MRFNNLSRKEKNYFKKVYKENKSGIADEILSDKFDVGKRTVQYWANKLGCTRGSRVPEEHLESEIDTETETNQYANDKEKEEDVMFMPSAWDEDKNRFLSIDEYCEKYALPADQVRSSKLVAHQKGHMIYNIAFNPTINEQSGIDEDFINDVIKQHIKPIELTSNPLNEPRNHKIMNLVYTDTHIGLDPNKEGNSLYGGKWDEEELYNRAIDMVANVEVKAIKEDIERLYITDLGDLADGLDGQTVRGGHELPQNMSNKEVFEAALNFKVKMVDYLASTGQFKEIVCNNICNSNHGGDFDFFINSAFKTVVESKYPDLVTVNNHVKFISHYIVGDHCFVISHGKDDKTLKFGFKPFLDNKAMDKIDQYIKANGLYNKAKYFHFCKGDSHQFIFDFSTSQDFDYLNYPALSPSSQWVQNNFKKGISGYVIETFDEFEEEIDFSYRKFKWNE